MTATNRDEFSAKTKEGLAKRVALLCSNPICRCTTSGPHTEPDKAINVGFAAHITAASPGGCRYDPTLTSEQRSSTENGIWLCGKCAKLIDSDESRYTVALLREWKTRAEEAALRRLTGQPTGHGAAPHRPETVREEHSRLCQAIADIYMISSNWMHGRMNKGNPGYRGQLDEKDWRSHLQLQYEAIKTIREMVRAGVDRWISPTLGTAPGRWTTELLAILREVEGHLWVTNPREELSRQRPGYFEQVAKDLTAHGVAGVTAVGLRNDFINSRRTSEAFVIKAIGRLQDLGLQLGDADISRFDS